MLRKNVLAVLTICLGLGAAAPALAQEGDPGARLLEEQRRRREQEALSNSTAGQVVNTPEAQGPVAEAPCFMIDGITVTGITALPVSLFEPILEEFRGQCLGQLSIGNLLARISAVYADRGFLTTRAYVPAQDIAGRHLKIEVLEGRVEAFVYQQVDEQGTVTPGAPRKIRTAFPIRPGDVFQLRDVEHGLEQMNRLPSSEAGANLVAGQAPGTSQIVVTERKADTLRGVAGVERRDKADQAEKQIRLGVEADDLLNINDRWSMSYAGTEHTNALSYATSFPFGRWSFSMDGSYSEELSAISTTADLFTKTKNFNLSAERLLYRNSRSKYFLYGTLSSYRNKRYINIVPLEPQHRNAVRAGVRNEHRMQTFVLAADTSLSFGTRLLGGDWIDTGSISGAPQTDFRKIETRVTFIRPFESGRQLTISTTAQYSEDVLYSNEQMEIGGWESVRGYAGSAVSGDLGAFMRAEYSFPAAAFDLHNWNMVAPLVDALDPSAQAQGGMRSFAFLDAGYIRSRAGGYEKGMVGAGFGVSAQIGGVVLNGMIAIPLVDMEGVEAGKIQAFMGLTVKVF